MISLDYFYTTSQCQHEQEQADRRASPVRSRFLPPVRAPVLVKENPSNPYVRGILDNEIGADNDAYSSTFASGAAARDVVRSRKWEARSEKREREQRVESRRRGESGRVRFQISPPTEGHPQSLLSPPWLAAAG